MTAAEARAEGAFLRGPAALLAESGRRWRAAAEPELGGERCGGKPGRGSENKVSIMAAVLRSAQLATETSQVLDLKPGSSERWNAL
jgi:hypothetical protein